MRILAMDTVGQQGSVALLEDEKLVSSALLTEPGGHVVTLPGQISSQLAAVGWSMAEVELLAVTLGPGSFTGLRIAMAVAKGMALGQAVDVVGVSTLDVVAAGSGGQEQGSRIASILDARRKELFFGLYQCSQAGVPEPARPPFIADPATLARELAADPALGAEPIYFNGSGLGPYGAIFADSLGDRFIPALESAWNPDPVLLGRLALHRFWERGGDRVDALQPLYLRRPDAVVKKMVL
jgi:tRNA threonylcarbamoyladenosine biosynthesis protein TsaB